MENNEEEKAKIIAKAKEAQKNELADKAKKSANAKELRLKKEEIKKAKIAKELIQFESKDGKVFKISLVVERNMHKIYLTDESNRIKNAKIHNTTSLSDATAYFMKVIRVYTNRLIKS